MIKFYSIFKFQYDIRWKHFETSIFLVFHSFFLIIHSLSFLQSYFGWFWKQKNKWIFLIFSVASQNAEAEVLFGALCLYSIFWEWQGYSLPCLFLNFASVIYCVSSCIPSLHTFNKISWWGGEGGVLHIFKFFLSWVGHRGGIGCLPSCVFVFIRYWWKNR